MFEIMKVLRIIGLKTIVVVYIQRRKVFEFIQFKTLFHLYHIMTIIKHQGYLSCIY